MSEWYFARNGQQQGPVSTDVIRRAVAQQKLSLADMVWREGMTDWQSIGQIEALAAGATGATNATGTIGAATAQRKTVQRQPVQQEQPTPAPVQPQPAPAEPHALAYSQRSGETIPLSSRGLEMLRGTKPWVRFWSVYGYVVCGIHVVMILILLASLYVFGAGTANLVSVLASSSVLLLSAAVVYFPSMYLGRYATKIGELCQTRGEDALEEAMAAQRSFWLIIGILGVIQACGVGVVILAVALLRMT